MHHFAAVLRLFGLLFLLPVVIAALAGEWIYVGIFAGLVLACAVMGVAGRRLESVELEHREALVITALAYLVYALLGACTFLPVASYADGFFEAMSGITTTGLSTLVVETLPTSLLFFRAYSQWLGGLGIVVLSLVVLADAGQTALQLYNSEAGRENLVGNIIGTTKIVMTIYGLLTLAAFASFWLVGLHPFDALLYALATLSTGGFAPHAASVGHYASSLFQGVVTLFMVLGAVSFPLYFLARREGVKRLLGNDQVRWLLYLIGGATLIVWALTGWRGPNLLEGLFHVSSALTTTGFNLTATDTWSSATKLIIITLMVIGGATDSTAGGIKLLRLLAVAQVARWSLLRSFLPDEVKLPVKVNGTVLSEAVLRRVMALIGLYVGIAFASTLLLTAAGFAVEPALFETVSALSTVGLSSGVTSAALPLWAKLVLCFDMWAGRLELIPVVVLLVPGNWRINHRSAARSGGNE